jgi:hypothetical protein
MVLPISFLNREGAKDAKVFLLIWRRRGRMIRKKPSPSGRSLLQSVEIWILVIEIKRVFSQLVGRRPIFPFNQLMQILVSSK